MHEMREPATCAASVLVNEVSEGTIALATERWGRSGAHFNYSYHATGTHRADGGTDL
jgi:hypothetical protein